MRSAEAVHVEAGSGGMKGNISRAMLPFISGHRAKALRSGWFCMLGVGAEGLEVFPLRLGPP